jgi:diacylglycerol kinase family enzyme
VKYFLDFDRTVFDTESFKRAVANHPSIGELVHQFKEVVIETFAHSRSMSRRRIFSRTLGTYMSHGRFTFLPQELKDYLYPDAVDFFARHGKDATIVTYGVRAFITAKVTSALSHLELKDIVYTPRKKGGTIKRLMQNEEGPFVFVDDAHFQLESVQKACPDVKVIEIRRDGQEGDGRWPVIRSFKELVLLGYTPPMLEKPFDLKTASVAVILNTASGSCDASSEEAMRTILADAGIQTPGIWCGGPEYMDEAFTAAHATNPDILIVLGGDGTIRTGAEACTPQGPLLIALPGGTMNVLPKALYGERPWQDALKETLAAPRIKSVSGGSIGGQQFFIAAVLGAPALLADARESLREGDIGSTLAKGKEALDNLLVRKVEYSFSPEIAGEADMVFIVCPLISEILDEKEMAFEAAAVHLQNMGDVVGLISAAAFGNWREDEKVAVVRTRSISVSAKEDIPVILDGETIELGTSAEITFMPIAFKALVPQS